MGGIVAVLHNAAWSPIQTPGFGSICGGYGKTGKGRHIQRQINSLTKWATYTFSLDVIIGDSWDGESLIIEVAPVRW